MTHVAASVLNHNYTRRARRTGVLLMYLSYPLIPLGAVTLTWHGAGWALTSRLFGVWRRSEATSQTSAAAMPRIPSLSHPGGATAASNTPSVTQARADRIAAVTDADVMRAARQVLQANTSVTGELLAGPVP